MLRGGKAAPNHQKATTMNNNKKIDLKSLNINIAMIQCPNCRSTNLIEITAIMGHNKKVRAWKCNECNKLILNGEAIKRPQCPKCGRTMRIKGYTDILQISVPRWYCPKCQLDLTTLIKKLMREAKKPPCPKCGYKHTEPNGTSRGHKKYFCPNCGAYFLVPRMDFTKTKELPTLLRLKKVKLIKADLDKLPRPLHRALTTMHPDHIMQALGINEDSIPCPYCGEINTSPKGWKKYRGMMIRVWKCHDCGKRFTVMTYIRLKMRELYPSCPKCGSNEFVVRYGLPNGKQKYYCKHCKSYFTKDTSADANLKKLVVFLEYVAGSPSLDFASSKAGVSRKNAKKYLETLAELIRVRASRRNNFSGVVIADEKAVKIRGKIRYSWKFIDWRTRYVFYADVTPGRPTKAALAGLISYLAFGVPIRIFVSDGLPEYFKAFRSIALPSCVAVFWNKKPGKSFPAELRACVVWIDDYGDHAVVSFGPNRLLPLGSFRCLTEEEIAEIILRFSFAGGVIFVSTRKSMSAVIHYLYNRDLPFSYHFICGYGYLKAYVERVIGTISRRMSRFFKNFSSLDGARRFIRAFWVYYNWFKRHKSLGCPPGAATFGVDVSDWLGTLVLLLGRRKILVSGYYIYAVCVLFVFAAWPAETYCYAPFLSSRILSTPYIVERSHYQPLSTPYHH